MTLTDIAATIAQQACERSADRVVVAYSGGLDSTVLLHLLHEGGVELPLEALHVDHGLQEDREAWLAHVKAQCAAWCVPLTVVPLALDPERGESVEAAARTARYEAFAKLTGRPLLLLAQHSDDQAETVLLQLLRGSGVRGLAAMPAFFRLGRVHVTRPLLDHSRLELLQYADACGLTWYEDPSNTDERFDRNFLRHRIMPVLKRRWPGAAKTLGRSAALAAEAESALAEQAAADSRLVRWDGQRFDTRPLQQLSAARQRHLFRFLVRAAGLALPPATRTDAILALARSSSARGQVEWTGAAARRYRNHIYLESPSAELPESWQAVVADSDWLVLPEGLGRVRVSGPDYHCADVRWQVREGGERVRPRTGGPSMPLARWFQQQGIPPWERQRLPLLRIDGEIAAAGTHVFGGFGALVVQWRYD